MILDWEIDVVDSLMSVFDITLLSEMSNGTEFVASPFAWQFGDLTIMRYGSNEEVTYA